MIDTEKVIKGVKHHAPETKCIDENGEWCPYFRKNGCEQKLLLDVLELLKDREPIEPIIEAIDEEQPGAYYIGGKWYREKCGACGSVMIGEPCFCPFCGREVLST